MNSPLNSVILFQIGPVPITQAVLTTWAIMAVLVLGSVLLTRRLELIPGKRQAALELIVDTMDTQIRETTGAEPAPYRGFIGTLFLFILGANWTSLVPGLEPPGLQWIAPYAGMTMVEYFRDKGQHALIVIDDLSKHAATYREIALLTRQSPGREAYPSDVFYIHARLLERAAKLSKTRGGGSLTALPIAETDSGNLSAYIPTNLISITDGQIVLDAALFHQGQKPAVDVGLSVSRVGGKTQAPVLRRAAGTLRLDYAQFLELEVFTRFGGMPDGRVRQQLTRGARIREALRQPQHVPFRLADEVALMIAVQAGLLDALSLLAVTAFRAGLPGALDADAPDVLSVLAETGDLDPKAREGLMAALTRLAASLSDDRTGATADTARQDRR